MDKFTDLMVKDSITGESLRADKLLEDIIDDLLAKNPAMPTVNNHQTAQGRDRHLEGLAVFRCTTAHNLWLNLPIDAFCSPRSFFAVLVCCKS